MGDPLSLSTCVIDDGVADEPVGRVTQDLSGLADGLVIPERSRTRTGVFAAVARDSEEMVRHARGDA